VLDGKTPVSNARVAWYFRPEGGPRKYGIFMSVWDNPAPEKKIDAIEIIAVEQKAQAFFIGMTAARRAGAAQLPPSAVKSASSKEQAKSPLAKAASRKLAGTSSAVKRPAGFELGSGDKWFDVGTLQLAVSPSLAVRWLGCSDGTKIGELPGWYLQGNKDGKSYFGGHQPSGNPQKVPIREQRDEAGRVILTAKEVPTQYFVWSEKMVLSDGGIEAEYEILFTETPPEDLSLQFSASFDKDILAGGPQYEFGEISFPAKNGMIVFSYEPPVKQYDATGPGGPAAWGSSTTATFVSAKPPYHKGQTFRANVRLRLPAKS